MSNEGQRVFVRAWDIYLDNKNLMSDDETEVCLANGSYNVWTYWISELEPLNSKVPLSKLEYELLKYYSEKGYKYIARDRDGELFIYKNRPSKMHIEWNDNNSLDEFKEIQFKDLFSFISWEDEKPYSIENILYRCEVD